MKHGQGTEKFGNGDLYLGNYVNGKPDGYGEYYWSNGREYKGFFKNGLRYGKGIWKKGSGHNDKYDGEWVNDKKFGFGVYNWASGNFYKGDYFDDLRHGYGEMFWIDGSIYKGNWEKGIQDGEGELHIPGSRPKIGLFQNNIFISDPSDKEEKMVYNRIETPNNKSNYQRRMNETSKNEISINENLNLPINNDDEENYLNIRHSPLFGPTPTDEITFREKEKVLDGFSNFKKLNSDASVQVDSSNINSHIQSGHMNSNYVSTPIKNRDINISPFPTLNDSSNHGNSSKTPQSSINNKQDKNLKFPNIKSHRSFNIRPLRSALKTKIRDEVVILSKNSKHPIQNTETKSLNPSPIRGLTENLTEKKFMKRNHVRNKLYINSDKFRSIYHPDLGHKIKIKVNPPLWETSLKG